MKEYNKIVDAADQKTKELEDSFKSIAEQTKSIDESFGEMTKRVNQSTLELAVARGEITEAEAREPTYRAGECKDTRRCSKAARKAE